MNKRQAAVLWVTGVLCVVAFWTSFPSDFQGGGDDYAFNQMCVYLTNLLMIVPAILIIGALLVYFLKDEKKASPRGPRTVLIVDDEGSIVRILELLLEKMGYRVMTALRGEAVMPMLEKEPVYFVLLDIRLPGKSGMEVLKEVKQTYPDLPVIMLTGLGYDDEAVSQALALGAAGYVTKTSSFRDLKRTIDNVLLNVP